MLRQEFISKAYIPSLTFFVMLVSLGLFTSAFSNQRTEASLQLLHGDAIDTHFSEFAQTTPAKPLKGSPDSLPFLSAPATPPSNTIKIYVMDFNPLINGQPLTQYKGWNDPDTLDALYLADVQQASGNYIGFQIVKHSIINTYPTKPSGFVFTNSQYLGCLSDSSPSYCSAIIDYSAVLNTLYDTTYLTACNAIATGSADEIWLWGGPWMGYWEYVIVSPGTLCPSVNRKFSVMGFSYERGVQEMLHDLGHRAEAALRSALGLTLWD